jgi:GNAT superfamily N-acetyltransferase
MMTIRTAEAEDAAAIAALTAELGYAADQETIARRLGLLKTEAKQLLIVGVVEDKVAGWLQAHASIALESGFRVEIVGLVVGAAHRRHGLARGLVGHAEEWARQLGAEAVVVRSNVQRVESHILYPNLGYKLSKTQAVYRKGL